MQVEMLLDRIAAQRKADEEARAQGLLDVEEAA